MSSDTVAPAVDMADLKRKSVRGGMATFASQGISMAIQLASTVVLSRLLSPDDYGIIAMVMAVTAFAGLFRDLGLSAAAIQKGNLTHAQMSNLFWLNVGMGTVLSAALAAASPLVAWFYGKPELVPLTLLLSSTFLICSLGTQHSALMVREMRFGRQAVTNIAGALCGLAVSIVLALRGHGYWALAWGNIVGGMITTALLFGLSSFCPGFWAKGAGIRSMIKFGANVTAFDLVNYFQRNLDKLLIGRVWGPLDLGLYTRAYSLLMLPITSIRGPINAVAFPALSKLQNDPEAFRDYYLKTTSLIAMLSMPLAAFLFVASDPIIEVVLGNDWLDASEIFSYLALAAFIQPVSGFAGSLLLSLGQGKRYLQCGLFNAIILSIAFALGLRWGAKGVALAYAIGNYVVLYPWLSWAFKSSPVRFGMFIRSCSLPLVVSLGGVVPCLIVSMKLKGFSPVFQGAGLAIVFFFGATIAMLISKRGRGVISQFNGIRLLLNKR